MLRSAACSAGAGLAGEDEDERPARRDPADRAPQPDLAEVRRASVTWWKHDRVGQRQRRDVRELIDEHDREERPERCLQRQRQHRGAADRVADRQQLFGGHQPVGSLAADKQRDDAGDRLRREDPADLCAREMQDVAEIERQQRQPRAPDHVLEEHHREARRGRSVIVHGGARGAYRNAHSSRSCARR